jgi:hypothetical protein
MNNSFSPFDKVVLELSKSVSDHERLLVQVSSGELAPTDEPQPIHEENILQTTLL